MPVAADAPAQGHHRGRPGAAGQRAAVHAARAGERKRLVVVGVGGGVALVVGGGVGAGWCFVLVCRGVALFVVGWHCDVCGIVVVVVCSSVLTGSLVAFVFLVLWELCRRCRQQAQRSQLPAPLPRFFAFIWRRSVNGINPREKVPYW